ncbi:sigma factor binding protein 2 chloroplastic [Phtheirospermum japonicum]|uniref:Sigma factor binding protein 2 chloroplastic n=1 Tax=Phtheirospermum japonicum TaxID=374723 RepID=A0A830B578_9LAMI|nr:sigma factor binding protein 2 chloroplastic [Phtheirospermum japonicum]
MDHKMVTANQKRANKQHPSNKTKKKGPLKVVYITNPIKFKASASQFRALVQELTGQDSDVPESARFTAGGGGGEVDKVAAAADRNYSHTGDQEGIKMGHTCEGSQNGSDPLFGFGSYDDNYNDDDGFCAMGNFQGLMASSFWINEAAHYLDDEFKG